MAPANAAFLTSPPYALVTSAFDIAPVITAVAAGENPIALVMGTIAVGICAAARFAI